MVPCNVRFSQESVGTPKIIKTSSSFLTQFSKK